MNTEQLLKILSLILTWCAILTGGLGVIAGLLWICERLISYIIKQLGIYPILIEFTWNRTKYKSLMKEEDYETFENSKP